MISGSGGHCEYLLLLSRLAGRSTPMTVTDHLNLSYRTLLFLFVLLGAPMAARCDTLEGAAKEFAHKVAAVLSLRERVAIDIQNLSTLTPEEVDRVSKAFSRAMQDSGFSVSLNGGEAIHVSVTLSENLKGFLWSAEIVQGDASRVVLIAVPRILDDRLVSNSMPIVLRGEKFWEGPEQILDADEATSSTDAGTLFLLQADGLIIRKKGTDSSFKVEIPTAQSATRTPFGSVQGESACQLLEFSPCVVVTLNGYICTIALETRTVGECHGPRPLGARDPVDPLIFFPRTFPRGRSEPFTEMSSHCGAEIQFGTGAGDYTQPDSVQAYDWRGATYVPFSDELSFPGPVMALHVVDRVPTAIVRNLETGNYEAYRISISCAQ
jgi:hypothetical protein